MVKKSRDEVSGYYDEFSTRQQRDFVYGNLRVTAAIKRVSAYIDQSTKSILDVGCGCGQLAWEYARNNPAIKVVGLDISPRNIEVAKLLFDLPNLSYDVSDLSNPPTGKFDLIALIDVYEHIPTSDWPLFNENIASCLAANGTLVLTTPTPMYQRYLMEHSPEELQVIDEIVEREDLFRLAEALKADPVLFEFVAIWKEYDYMHFVASRNASQIKKKSSAEMNRSLATKVFERLQHLKHLKSVRERKKIVHDKLGIRVS